MPTTGNGTSRSKIELQPCNTAGTQSDGRGTSLATRTKGTADVARALVDALKRNDTLTIQRITRRPDIARIAVVLAEQIVMPSLQPCGTRAAAERHLYNGEELDPACLAARRRYYRDIKRGLRPGRSTPASSTASSPTTSSTRAQATGKVVDAAPAHIDPVVVERLIDGQPPLHVTKTERIEAVRVLNDRGRTPGEIAAQLHMSGTRVAQILDGFVRDATDTPADSNRQESA